MLRLTFALLLTTISISSFADNATAYFIEPTDGAELTNPVTIKFGLKGMGVAPAGVAKEGTGHHHLIIDAELPDLTKPIPSDEKHRHFGKGQTETELNLPAGKHTLQLLLGDHLHTPHSNAVKSEKITITVK